MQAFPNAGSMCCNREHTNRDIRGRSVGLPIARRRRLHSELSVWWGLGKPHRRMNAKESQRETEDQR